MATTSFGWDLLYSSVEKEIENNQDVLVCLAHLVLVSNGFKCIGLGKSTTIDGLKRRETLPKGWNEDYAIRYVYQGHLYHFKATSLDGGVMLNLESSDKKSISLVQLKTRSVVTRSGSLHDMIPDYENLVDKIKKQMFEKVVGFRKYRENSCQTQECSRDTSAHPSFDLLKGNSFGDVKVLYKERPKHFKI